MAKKMPLDRLRQISKTRKTALLPRKQLDLQTNEDSNSPGRAGEEIHEP
jgi:hypothetical protein